MGKSPFLVFGSGLFLVFGSGLFLDLMPCCCGQTFRRVKLSSLDFRVQGNFVSQY